ncbi:hypothetical protein D3C72_1952870 [compost metagenome]
MTQVDAFQDFQRVRVHRAGLAGGLHAAGTGIDEQFVLEAVAQFFQAVTHCGLADAKHLGYAGDAVLLVHGDEHQEVLHVEFSKRITVQHPLRLAASPCTDRVPG